ncbi:MAG: hypothetical protein IK077_14010 [Thermoguttaceae bacterium]|nr:hypothetical protein [Thermoguttaceae bacterium]
MKNEKRTELNAVPRSNKFFVCVGLLFPDPKADALVAILRQDKTTLLLFPRFANSDASSLHIGASLDETVLKLYIETTKRAFAQIDELLSLTLGEQRLGASHV